MRTWWFPCLMVLGLMQPRWCLAQAAADEARIDRETQEDVEVLRRIVTETVQGLYQKADERALRQCAACHVVSESHFDERISGEMLQRNTDMGLVGVASLHWHSTRERGSKSADETAIRGLANYAPGQGIVVQLEAPPPVVDRDVKPWLTADESASKRWDALLREARGEPEKKSALNPLLLPPDQRRVHRLILTEKVVDALAENGRNLRHLKPEERVIVAFTFPPPSREKRERERATLLRHYFGRASSAASASSSALPGTGIGSGGSAGVPSAGAAPSKKEDRDARIAAALNQGLEGDLLLRQEKYVEAVAAYEKALTTLGVRPNGMPVDPRRPEVPAAAVAKWGLKLIQAQVGAKNLSEAKAIMQWLEGSPASSTDELAAMRRMYLDLVGLPPTPEEVKAFLAETRPDRREALIERLLAAGREEEGPSRVPARMVISCTRQQLDDVATGKLTKLDFAGKVSLKYYRAIADKQEPQKPTK